jgi:hypothetical protein
MKTVLTYLEKPRVHSTPLITTFRHWETNDKDNKKTLDEKLGSTRKRESGLF